MGAFLINERLPKQSRNEGKKPKNSILPLLDKL